MSEVDFDSYLDEQIAEPVAEETPVEATEETPVERPRNPDGTFASAAEETPEETPAPLLAGKYKTAEALEEAYKNLEREKGRLAQELGEARKQPEPEQQYDLSGIDDSIADNPQLAAQAAWVAKQQGDQLTYERIVQAWGEQDPFGAARFDARVAAWESNQETLRQVQPQIETAAQHAQQTELESALGIVAGRHEDFAAVVGSLDDERLAQIIQGGFPQEVLAGLTGPQASKEAVFETLYRWVKAEQTDLLSQASAQANAQAETAAREQKQQAAVANATSPPASEGTGDQELDEFYKFMREPSPTNWLTSRTAQ
jgi:hypothetical protein